MACSRMQWISVCLCVYIVGLVNGLEVAVLDGFEESSELRKIGDYFQTKEDSSIVLKCEIRREVILSSTQSRANLEIDNEIVWGFRYEMTEPVESQPKWLDITDSLPKERRCQILEDYITPKEEQRFEIFCSQELHLKKVATNQEGRYLCNATLAVHVQDESLVRHQTQDQVQIFVEVNDILSFVVTCIIITIVILVVISALCCRTAGHRFAWEHSTNRVHENAMDQLQSMHRVNSTDENGLWHARNRYNSNASNMSGIVFQTDTEGMAKLLERLDNVEDGTSESSSRIVETDEQNAAGVSITVSPVDETRSRFESRKISECKDEPSKADDSSLSSKNKSSHLRVSALPTPTTPGRLRRAFSFFTKSTQSHPSNNNKIHPPKRSTGTNLKRRRSMLGIFPSAIGIGSGAIYGDDEFIEELMALENARKGHFGDNVASLRQKQSQHHSCSGLSGTSPPNAHGFDHNRFQSGRPNSPMMRGVRRSSISENVIKEEEPTDGKDIV